MVDINALLPEGMPEEASGVKECLINGGLGGLIDWDYWARLNDIKPEEAAKLAHYINPKVQDEHIDSLSLKFRGDLCIQIIDLSKWLEERSKKWTLTELILALESEECRCYDTLPPYGMIQAVEPNPPETLLRKEARLSAAQTLGLDVSKNTHYFFPPALRAKRIARLQYPFDKAKQSEFTRQIETTLNRSNPESDYHATYGAADVNRLLRMKLYNKPSEHIRAWYNATQPPLPIGTAEPDITPDTQPRQERKLNKLEKQQQAILAVIALKQFEAMAIPDGEKGTIQFICEAEYHELFRAETAFDRAWKTGNGTKWRMEHYESYAHRGKD